MNRPFSHCVLIGVARYFFRASSLHLFPLASTLHSYRSSEKKNILAKVLLLWYTQAKEVLDCKLSLSLSLILNNLLNGFTFEPKI